MCTNGCKCKTDSVTVPITEYDVEEFNDLLVDRVPVNWTFKTKNGKEVSVKFVAGE